LKTVGAMRQLDRPVADCLGDPAAQDRQLMAAIARRDPAALERLYRRHAAAVLACCMRVLGDRSEAEEVLGDIFWEVWDRADRYDPSRSSPLVYLMTLSRSRAIDRLRRLRRRVPVEGDRGDSLDSLPNEVDPGGPSPFSDAVAAERRTRVRRALAQLGPAERRVVELSFFHGLTHSEIAERLQEPLGTTKTRIRRGLIRLRDALQGPEPGVEPA
jgi:RNA polymerase sigma-70 factor (ECF subfamily)